MSTSCLAWPGASVPVMGATIGEYAVVAAHAVGTRNVPAHTVVGGIATRVTRDCDGQPA